MNKMHICLLCLGSNQDARLHLENAEKALNLLFSPIWWGDVVETVPEAFECTSVFLNRAVVLHTQLEENELRAILKNIEQENGRTPECKWNGIIPLDIDILLYDGHLSKPSDLEKNYVRQALRRLPVRLPFLTF